MYRSPYAAGRDDQNMLPVKDYRTRHIMLDIRVGCFFVQAPALPWSKAIKESHETGFLTLWLQFMP